MAERSNVIFREVQRFRQAWLWLIIALIGGISWYGAIQQLVLNTPFGNKPAPDAVMLVIWVVFGIAFPAFSWSSKLVIEVRSDGLYMRLSPFHLSFRRIALDELGRYEVQSYSPIKEYGGWGIRYGLRGKAYNVSGNRGVQLELLDGNRILIGSQKPEELAKAIDSALGKTQ